MLPVDKPSLWIRLATWWNNVFNPERANTNESSSRLDGYKAAISKTLDKYISWWKLSWFGHHHDARARTVKEAIQCADSTVEIQHILKRQQAIVAPDNQNNLPVTSWIDSRWNEFNTVKNKYPVSQSGYFKVLSEALSIDASNLNFKP